MNMNKDKQLRRLKVLVHKHNSTFTPSISHVDRTRLNDENFLNEYFDKKISYLESWLNNPKSKIPYEAFIEIKKIVNDLKISTEEYRKIADSEYLKRTINPQNTYKETRDNKGVYVGSGESNTDKIRYPSKNRSKRTWKIFYQMFPRAAKDDDFDGKTSKRMK